MEVYREMGLKFEEAISDLSERLEDPDAPKATSKRQLSPEEEAASMSTLQAMMGGTDFRGARG
jgi:hypothetical protein